MPAGAEETRLGAPEGAVRQYRYGRLHIREYPGEYRVHMDRVDPRRDPLGHLVADAPEVPAGLAAAGLAGALAARWAARRTGSRWAAAAAGLAAAAAAGAAGYAAARRAKGAAG